MIYCNLDFIFSKVIHEDDLKSRIIHSTKLVTQKFLSIPDLLISAPKNLTLLKVFFSSIYLKKESSNILILSLFVFSLVIIYLLHTMEETGSALFPLPVTSCVHVRAHTHVCVHTYVHAQVRAYVCTRMLSCACMCVHVHTFSRTCAHTHACTDMLSRTDVCVHAHTSSCTHMHACIHTVPMHTHGWVHRCAHMLTHSHACTHVHSARTLTHPFPCRSSPQRSDTRFCQIGAERLRRRGPTSALRGRPAQQPLALVFWSMFCFLIVNSCCFRSSFLF